MQPLVIKWRFRKLSVTILGAILLSLLFSVNCVLSDVVLLQESNGTNLQIQGSVDAFLNFIKEGDRANRIPNEQRIFPEGEVKWQMPGYAVFIKNGQVGNIKVYAAKKRKGNSLVFEDLFKYDMYMHTERQLIIAALEQYASINIGIEDRENDNNLNIRVVKGGLKIAATITEEGLNGIKHLAGQLCVFTYAPPCMNSCNDNGRLSCWKYYERLASCTPNILYNVYFVVNKETRLNGKMIKEFSEKEVKSLVDCIKILINEGKQIGGFAVNNNILQQNGIDVLTDSSGNKTIKERVNAGDFNILIKGLNAYLENESISSDVRVDIFKKVLSSLTTGNNVVYHAIAK